jgi:hypothetical protein
VKKEYTYNSCISEYLILKAQRSEWDSEWQEISEYLIPGRGIYDDFSIPRKRKLTSPKAINQAGRDALRVLASGIQGGLIPSTRPWLEIKWKNKDLNKVTFLKEWIATAQELLNTSFNDTNYYTENSKAITEICAFGNGMVFVNSDIEDVPFSFHMLTSGSYVFATDSLGRLKKLHRVLLDSPQNLVDSYGDRMSEGVKRIAENREGNRDYKFVMLLESIVQEDHLDKPYKRYLWEVGATAFGTATYSQLSDNKKRPLRVDGFYEFPCMLGRWDVLGNDDFGIGPGSEALPEIKRLQEVEKASRLATHKELDPPLWAPTYMKGLLKTLPGSRNYYRNANDKVESLYQGTYKQESAAILIERIEASIGRKFFNDIFLTAARDPNLSPLKAAEVVMRDGEKLLRLGPVIEGLVPEFFKPQIIRCFNICLRKGVFPEIPPEYHDMIGDITIEFTSPLAQAQKLVAAKSIEISLAFIGQASAVEPSVMDKVDIDAAVDEYFDAHGTPTRILRSPEEVQARRKQREEAQAADKKKQEAMMQAELATKAGPAEASAAKVRAETGQIMTDSLVTQQELGGIM